MWAGASYQDSTLSRGLASPVGRLFSLGSRFSPEGNGTITKSQEPCHRLRIPALTLCTLPGAHPRPHASCVHAGRPYLREGAVWLELLGGDTFFKEA